MLLARCVLLRRASYWHVTRADTPRDRCQAATCARLIAPLLPTIARWVLSKRVWQDRHIGA